MREYTDNNDIFDVQQGKQFLTLKNDNISNTYNKSILLQEDRKHEGGVNGFLINVLGLRPDKTQVERGSRLVKSFFSPLRDTYEGFTGGFGESAVNNVNQNQIEKLQQHENIFRQKLADYSIAKQSLMEDTKNYLTNASNVKNLSGKNVRLSDGTIGYVTNRGFFKQYPDMTTFNNLEGVNGCPKSFQNISASKANKNVGDLFGSEPALYLGTPMKPNQPCTQTGINVQVSSLQDPNTVNTKLEGCYSDNLTDKFSLQSDIVNSSVETCKLRAIDMGRSAYALKPNTSGEMNCWVANQNISAQDVNKTIATKKIISKSLVDGKSFGTNSVAGIMNNGQLILGNLNSQSNLFNSKDLTTFTEIPAISGCDPVYGSRININTASYGANCNGQIQLESIL